MGTGRLKSFCRDEEGALSFEALFWLVMVVFVLGIFVDGTAMFNAQDRILRITQDANRAYAIQMLKTTTDVQNYIDTRLGVVSKGVSATSTISSDGERIQTTVTAPATDFQIFGLFPAFSGMTLTVKADHLIEPL